MIIMLSEYAIFAAAFAHMDSVIKADDMAAIINISMLALAFYNARKLHHE